MTLQTGGYGFIFSNSVMRLILEGRLQGYRVRLLKGTTLSAFEAKLLKKKKKKVSSKKVQAGTDQPVTQPLRKSWS